MKSTLAGIVCLLGVILICSSRKAFSQAISLSGSEVVTTGSQETYVVSSVSGFNQNTVITWSVSGGTIRYQITDPTASSIYCIVDWSSSPLNGYIIFSESYGGATAKKGCM